MSVFSYYENEKINFKLDKNDFCTVLGGLNKRIINNLYNLDKNDFVKINYMSFKNLETKRLGKRINFVLNDNLELFVCSKVKDEINFVLENKGLSPLKITELIAEYSYKFKIREILDCDPIYIGTTNQILLKFIIAFLCEPKVLVLDNILECMDYKAKKLIIKELKKFIKAGNIVINFTNNIEEALLGNKVILTKNNMVVAEGNSMAILNEEKLLKRLGYGQPFDVELCKLLMDYELIDKYYFNYKKLVDKIWK